MYRLLKTLVSPERMTDLTFERLVELAKAHFNPNPSPIIKRYEFNTRSQEEGETVATSVAELCKIAQYCEYGAVLSDMLCDRLVCRIRDKGVQCRLLRETNLPFDKALEMALTDETDSRRLTDNGHVTTDYNVPLPTTDKSRETQESPTVNHVDRPKQNKSTQPKRTGGPKDQSCDRCGGKHHPAHCTYKEYECHHCKRCGHLARVCRKVQEEDRGPAGAEQGRVSKHNQ